MSDTIEMSRDKGFCFISKREIVTLPTRDGVTLTAAIQGFVIDRLKKAGLPIPASCADGIVEQDNPSIRKRIDTALKEAGATKFEAVENIIEDGERILTFRWR